MLFSSYFIVSAFICLLRTWLTEPGIIPKVQATKAIVKVTPNESSILIIILQKGQRKIASLMVSVKNDKKEYIQVYTDFLLLFVEIIRGVSRFCTQRENV